MLNTVFISCLIDSYTNLVLKLTTLSLSLSEIIISLFVVRQYIFIPGKFITRPSLRRYVQKCRHWRKWRFWRNFAKVVDEMSSANKLTQLEGPRIVCEFGENGEFWESGDSGEISPWLWTKCRERIN